ncbi:unnamed protein product [Phaeothamnion confervicola]
MIFFQNLLFILIATLGLGVAILAILPSHWKLREYTLAISTLSFIESLGLLATFDSTTSSFQFSLETSWILNANIGLTIGVDGISLFFVVLTTLLFPLCLLASWNSITRKTKSYLLAFLLMEFLLVAVFCVLDLLLFYILFESVLIPMFLVIGIWGSRERKIRAGYLFFLYTLLGSLVMLLAIGYIFMLTGTTEYMSLLQVQWTFAEEKWLWMAFFVAFATKVPMLPVHIWLPEAHVEAPTAGSVLLAGILLKLGSYGFLRFSLPLFPSASLYFAPFVYVLAILGIVYTSLTAIRQTDLKRIIAYTSVAHMNLVMLGLFSFNAAGLEGAILQSLSHGFVSSALFLLIGVLYDRYHTRMVKYYSGLMHTMPLFGSLFLFFTMANIGLPPTSSFVGEFLILVGIFQTNTTACVWGATGMVLGGVYALWLFNRIAYGNIKDQFIPTFTDISRREFVTFFPLVVCTLGLGLYPEWVLSIIQPSVQHLVDQLNLCV